MKTLFDKLRADIKEKGAQYVWNKYHSKVKKDSLNAIISTIEEYPKTIDKNIKKSSLYGIPILYKDNIFTKHKDNLNVTCGSLLLKDYKATYNATVVDRLEKKGMKILGKTNLNEFGMGSDTTNMLKGRTLNPYNKKTHAGGSSGGSASAVASGLAPVALGTDTGGSVRAPASKCGVVGIKPSYGSVSRHGIVAYGCSLEQVGVITHNVLDAVEVLKAMGGKDIKDPTTLNIKDNFFSKRLGHSIKGSRIGVDRSLLASIPHQESDIIIKNIHTLEKNGCEIIDIKLPNLENICSVYYVLAFAEGYSDLARFDGINWGHIKCEGSVNDRRYITRNNLCGRTKISCIAGNYFLQKQLYGNDSIYKSAQRYRSYLSEYMYELYQKIDAIILPVIDSTELHFCEDRYTVISNLVGGPSISLPVGMIEGLPWGIQLMADRYQDASLCNIAHFLESTIDTSSEY